MFQHGGYAYMCGGARAFGAAVEREKLPVFQEQGNMTLEEATDHLRKLMSEGRLCEDWQIKKCNTRRIISNENEIQRPKE